MSGHCETDEKGIPDALMRRMMACYNYMSAIWHSAVALWSLEFDIGKDGMKKGHSFDEMVWDWHGLQAFRS
jgi:hypothetical protein